MTITSHGEIQAPDGWWIEWSVNEGRGKGTSHSPDGRVHVNEGEITAQYLVRRITIFVQRHFALTQAEMEL